MTEPRTPFAHPPTLVGDQVLLRPARPQEDAQADRLDLTVVDRSTGRDAGEIGLDEWDEANSSCRLGLGLAPGDGGALDAEAVRLLTDHAFRVLGLHRVSTSVHRHDGRGQRACQEAGFRVEGVRRQAVRHKGRWSDVVELAALAEDWGHELPSGPEPAPTGVLEDDPGRRLTDAEWTRLRDYLRRYVQHELDQWDLWRIDTPYGPVAVTLSNSFPEGDPGPWRPV
ncbi:GNAT family N-acetyltransferase [Kitasatospora sp. NPDC004531]